MTKRKRKRERSTQLLVTDKLEMVSKKRKTT
jgi:hypothetical protein